ncbi:ATP-binding protein, partial [Streptomyces sp. 2MCAF27]
GATRYPEDAVRDALDLDPGTPVVLCDARERESAKNVLISVVEHAMMASAARR